MPEEPNPQREQQQKPPRRHWHAAHRRISLSQAINIGLTVALVLAAASQIFVYLRQAHIMKVQATISDRQLKLTMDLERAVVIVSDMQFSAVEPAVFPENLTLSVKNSGRRIGEIDNLFGFPLVLIYDKTMPDEPNYNGSNFTTLVSPPISPGETKFLSINMEQIVPMHGVRQSLPKTDQILAGVKSGEMPFIFYGFINYKTGLDDNSRKGVTGFCFVYVPLGNRGTSRQFATCNKSKYTYAR
jgi:hypothetical protein